MAPASALLLVGVTCVSTHREEGTCGREGYGAGVLSTTDLLPRGAAHS